MTKNNEEAPMIAIDRLVQATNDHDIEGIVHAFADDYALEAPLHPQRSFRGRDQVRRNWTQILGAVPDLHATIVRSAVQGESVWTEWEMSGTRRDGTPHLMRGVFIFGVAGGLVRWGRMFLEPVEQGGADMSAALQATLANRDAGSAGR